VIVILGLAALSWRQSSVVSKVDRPGARLGERVLTLESQAVSEALDINGTIEAARTVVIVAPFEGVIRERRVQIGDRVNDGDVLVMMDTSEIAARRRDARAAYVKAEIALEALQTWSDGPEVRRARRTLEASRMRLAVLVRQEAELKTLLDQGIASRGEYDGLAQQLDEQRHTVEGAADDLAAIRARGDTRNRELAELERENARIRLEDLTRQMGGATVVTTVRGIVIRPPVEGNTGGSSPAGAGASVALGAPLCSVADTSSFVVTGAVDEIDVSRLRVGQRATIVTEALPGHTFEGELVRIGAEAQRSQGGGRSASFEVRATFSIGDDVLRQAMRIGMSARLTVEVYANPAALIIPPSAVVRASAGPRVRVRRNGETITLPVILGHSFPAGVEVVAGLSPGDVVLLP
jgi:multidrug efflux pump subunit AcrA (membrane-fusion protein)